MEINLGNAAKHFYSTHSLEMVYFEAVANSIDAKSTRIDIRINIEDFNKPETLLIEIADNGQGFNEHNFGKFSKLLEIDDEKHKGTGRLVYLHYFDEIIVNSEFENHRRNFKFTESWRGESTLVDYENKSNSTTLKFSDYSKKSIKQYDYLKPASIKNGLELHFFPLFHSLKIGGVDLIISITLQTANENPEHDFFNDTKEISVKDLPDLQITKFDAESLDMFQKMEMHYSIRHEFKRTSIITAVCADGRTIPIDIIPNENIPAGYEIIFLLYSDYFTGRVNSLRDKLDIGDYELKSLKRLFTKNIARILNDQIPYIKERNEEVSENLTNKYPHLQGYFEKESAGLIDQSKSIDTAQKKFFQAQKEILEATTLTEMQYQKSLEISSRLLMEYVIYRTKIINKLKEVDKDHTEADIHKIIVPMKQTLHQSNFMNDIYMNNAWLLDDKYMTYTTILSDEEMDKLVSEIALDEENVEKDDTRPDIAIIFSNDPKTQKKVDVVIIELKKLKLKLAKREEIISQLRQRARKLLKYYPNCIQRIWFYGIVDIDREFRKSLKEDGYTELFSTDQLFYKEQPIIVEDENSPILTGIYILSFDAFLKDAESRNSTFLNILKEGMKRKYEDEPETNNEPQV